jgi:MFS family permease
VSRRLDASPWRPLHTRILLALGIGWALDAFEIQIVGSVIKPIAGEFSLSATDQTVWVWVVWFLGVMLGALVFGYLADRVGRRRLFVATLVLYSTAAILTASSWSFASFLAFRFLTGLGVGGEYSAVSSAIAEFMPARRRGRTNALVMNFWSIGGIVAGLVGILFVSAVLGASGWRYAFLFGAVSALYGLYARRLIPESPRWLASRGRLNEANAVIEAVTGGPGDAEHYDPRELRGSFMAQLGELWREHRGKLLFGMSLDFSEAAAYYGLFTFLPVFVLTPGVVNVGAAAVPYYYVVANIGGLAGGLLVSWTLDRFGRRPTVFWAYTAAAGSVLLIAAAARSGSPGLTLAAFTFAVFCASCAWMSAYPTFSELFPTHLRATGVGVCVGFGRIGAIVGVVVLAESATAFGLWTAFLCLSGLWLLGSVAAAVWWSRGIEGRGRALEALARA